MMLRSPPKSSWSPGLSLDNTASGPEVSSDCGCVELGDHMARAAERKGMEVQVQVGAAEEEEGLLRAGR